MLAILVTVQPRDILGLAQCQSRLVVCARLSAARKLNEASRPASQAHGPFCLLARKVLSGRLLRRVAAGIAATSLCLDGPCSLVVTVARATTALVLPVVFASIALRTEMGWQLLADTVAGGRCHGTMRRLYISLSPEASLLKPLSMHAHTQYCTVSIGTAGRRLVTRSTYSRPPTGIRGPATVRSMRWPSKNTGVPHTRTVSTAQ